ncbi:Predicted ATP-dependent endonuclease of the OLD family, contains P-loop ATPase and TOPRIM domains [Draconibacterium orientale]|uniref:ATPase AAA n=1 Tax=Draconibacterium orientale TaxID=1168034 RepID=X5DHR7_9BACT|nr:ATP-dependent endonuclease [Draconibacterium orientale]AHW60634.1 ATPase AAA [Draconibacterium orientale]SET06755.1 Predicted ATP-dependent endonuclease of the OLD family, contains P-loop ATPase and TOPRIM domains [Draconibacterium orientale]
MYINKIIVQNFRLLKNSILDLENQEDKDLSILIGRNNSGKTSFIMLFDKFLKKSSSFNFDDFPVSLRQSIFEINEETDINDISIRLIIEITYTDKDNLENLSEFILDLNPSENKVHILFECSIDKKRLLKEIESVKPESRKRFIKKNLCNYINTNIYTFDTYDNLKAENRNKLIEKDKKSIDNLINYQVIHAKRSVASSEAGESSKKVLSNLATKYYDKKTENQLSSDDLDVINTSLLEMDKTLEGKYEEFFDNFLNKSKDFLAMTELRVVSDLESKEIISNHSKIVYGSEDESLPEHLNGLGYMNILYLLLQLEIKKEFLIEGNKDINLLFVEEPEAHTHPQMQTVFIEKVRTILEDIPALQTFITTHSSHIVKNSNFKDIRYFYNDLGNRIVTIKNFYTELQKKYEKEEDEFKFLNQYLSIASAELFFAEKIIFIEGLTEKLLLPYFIQQYDKTNTDEVLLSSQNISLLEIGANAKAFSHFIDFLGIKALIITDIDTTKKNANGRYSAEPVKNATHISNATIKHFYKAPDFSQIKEWSDWFINLKEDKHHKEDSNIKLSFQLEEKGYHGRSFEESFISINVDNLKANISEVKGLKDDADESLNSIDDIDELTKSILEKKSDFASSLLWLALTKDVDWNMPSYIKKGLVWIAK